MRYIHSAKRRREAQVGPAELVRKIGTMVVYEDPDPDAVLGRLRAMTYGSTSSFEVKRRAIRNATAFTASD